MQLNTGGRRGKPPRPSRHGSQLSRRKGVDVSSAHLIHVSKTHHTQNPMTTHGKIVQATMNGQSYFCELVLDEKENQIRLENAVPLAGPLTDSAARTYVTTWYRGDAQTIIGNQGSTLTTRNLTAEESLSLETVLGLLRIAEEKAPKQVVVDFLLSKR